MYGATDAKFEDDAAHEKEVTKLTAQRDELIGMVGFLVGAIGKAAYTTRDPVSAIALRRLKNKVDTDLASILVNRDP